eukprot:scaffold4548_cov137-Ochromonas_danica.AAC.2
MPKARTRPLSRLRVVISIVIDIDGMVFQQDSIVKQLRSRRISEFDWIPWNFPHFLGSAKKEVTILNPINSYSINQ